MNVTLIRSCVWLWILGLFGMFVARAVLQLDPRAVPSLASIGLVLVGGGSYAGLVTFALAAATRRSGTIRSSADVSAILRRRE